MAGLTWTVFCYGTTAALTLLGTWDSRDTLLLLEICQTTSLVMNVLDLARGLSVEVDELLSSGCTGRLFVVGSQPRQKRVGLLCDAIGLVN